jgi:hypothetical protein
MQIFNTDTQAIETISITNPDSGVEFTRDLIGNAGGFDNFGWDDDREMHACDQSTFDWWADVVGKYQVLEDLEHSLKQEHGSDAVNKVLEDSGCGYNDFADVPAIALAALHEHFADTI